MKNLSIYRAEVKYSGKFEDYDPQDLFNLMIARTRDQDNHYKDIEVEDAEADLKDRTFIVRNKFPCNKIAECEWYEIREDEECE